MYSNSAESWIAIHVYKLQDNNKITTVMLHITCVSVHLLLLANKLSKLQLSCQLFTTSFFIWLVLRLLVNGVFVVQFIYNMPSNLARDGKTGKYFLLLMKYCTMLTSEIVALVIDCSCSCWEYNYFKTACMCNDWLLIFWSSIAPVIWFSTLVLINIVTCRLLRMLLLMQP